MFTRPTLFLLMEGVACEVKVDDAILHVGLEKSCLACRVFV